MILLYMLFQFGGSLNAMSGSPSPGNHLPTPFTDVMHAHHEGPFYDQQAAEWQALATSDCGDEDAWFHYYKTARYSNRFGSGDYDLGEILNAAVEATAPDGFVSNYLRYVHEQNPDLRAPFLLRAHTAAPERHEAYTAMIAHHVVNGDVERRDELLKKLHAADPIPTGVVDYNFNQLNSVAENGVLITNGDADTYPSWLLQSAYGIRPDVLVVNLHLLRGYRAYLNRTLAGLGLESLDETVPPPSANELIVQLGAQPRPVFLAATVRPNLAVIDPDKLYLTGLAFRYSPKPVDNLGALATNYQIHWRLESLRQPLAENPAQAVADQLNQSYLPALLELYQYQQAKKATGFPTVLPLINTLAARAGRSGEVADYLRGDDPPQLASKEPGLRAKDIYKGKVYVPEGMLHRYVKDGDNEEIPVRGFFVGGTEVSNADYQLFLEDLLRQRKFRMLDSAAVAPLDMVELKKVFPEAKNPEAYATHLTGSHPAFADYPVVNVSRRAVELYATWLAQAYNQDPKRIDGKNVRFRLMTAREFEYAARGGRKFAPYPWGGPYIRNSRGCYLANFNTMLPHQKNGDDYFGIAGQPKESPEARKARLDELAKKEPCGNGTEDGGVLTVAVESYYPNDYGLYNMAGNAAEMIAEEGKTMGGSWMHEDFYMQVNSVKEQAVPHPSTGFRLIMEYVE